MLITQSEFSAMVREKELMALVLQGSFIVQDLENDNMPVKSFKQTISPGSQKQE